MAPSISNASLKDAPPTLPTRELQLDDGEVELNILENQSDGVVIEVIGENMKDVVEIDYDTQSFTVTDEEGNSSLFIIRFCFP